MLKFTMVRNNNPITPNLQSLQRIIHMQNPLQHQRPLPMLPHKLQLLPRPKQPRMNLPRPIPPQHLHLILMFVSQLSLSVADGWIKREGYALVVSGGEILRGHEGWVGGSDLDSDAVHEGEIGFVEIVRAPAHAHGVEGDDAGCEARLLGPSEQGEGDFFVSWPIASIFMVDKYQPTESLYNGRKNN